MGLIERRIGLLFAVFLGLLAIGATKAAWLGVVKAGTLSRAATTQQEADVVVPARRGSITDDHGIELAVSEPAVDIAATPYLIKNAAAVADKLAPLLDKPADELLRALTRSTGFSYLARRVPATQADKAKKLGIEGLEFIPEYRRAYPLDWTASQLLGSVGTDGEGLSGLEYSMDSKLKGSDGERRMVKDALGTPLEMRDTTPVKRGQTVRLTLDKRLQDRAEEVLADVGKTWQPKGATAIVMDPNSGAILALANWPRVNANDPPSAAPDYARGNRAIGATYEPGSTFKAFTVAAALEDGKVTPDTPFDIPPVLQFSDREIKDAEAHGYETMTTKDILKKSSNIGAVLIAKRVGTEPFDSWIHRFGFGKPTGVDLPGEEQGIVTPLDEYSGSTMGNLPIGQGLAVTPMQMAAGYAAIANGGILRAPRIVDAVGGRKRPLPKGKRVISEATAASVRSMLEGVLGPGGTASGAAIKGYQLAGKTGTAQKPDPKGGYSETAYVASFVGFAPAAHPKLLAAVMVDEPKGEIYGGQVAAPAWKDIMNFALQYLKISP
jgi:cell division protein FtsI (penicillin-binding protein 3)